MKKRKFWIILITVIVLLSFVGAAIYGLMRRGRENKIAQNSAPTVQLTFPGGEELVAPDSEVLILASAFGRTPIANIQLWMDGQLLETQSNTDGSAGTFNATFNVIIPNGQHMLSARTVDAEGLVGQTLPHPLAASPDYVVETPSLYTAEGEESLEDIADKVGLEAEDLEDINPDLGGGVLPAGTDVNLPSGDPSAQTAPAPPAPPPPTTTTGGGPVTKPNLPMLAAVANYTPPAVGFGDLLGSSSPLLPAAPNGVQASAENCQLTLTWQDNSVNEDVFNIWISGLGIPARIIGTADSGDHVGQVWYQVPTPMAGVYSVWVEAVNAYGTQPSEPVWLGVPAQQCPHYTATHLQIEINKIVFFGPTYERLYTYISAEGRPEQRFPADDSDFMIGAFDQDVKTEYILHDQNIFTVPIPDDNELNFNFKGMGWSGGVPYPLGEWPINVVGMDWKHVEMSFPTQNYEVFFTITQLGETRTEGTATFFDPSITAPKNVWIQKPSEGASNEVKVGWDWGGDENAISGFTVFLNDEPLVTVPPDRRENQIRLPKYCGKKEIFEVAANTIAGQSLKSDPKTYDIGPCRAKVEITLFSMEVHRTTVSNIIRYDCAPLQIRYVLYAGNGNEEVSLRQPMKTEQSSPASYPWRIRCNKYYRFEHMALPNKVIVDVDQNSSELYFGAIIDTSESGYAAEVKNVIDLSVEQWETYDKGYRLRDQSEELDVEINFHIKGSEWYYDKDDDLSQN